MQVGLLITWEEATARGAMPATLDSRFRGIEASDDVCNTDVIRLLSVADFSEISRTVAMRISEKSAALAADGTTEHACYFWSKICFWESMALH